MDYWPLINALIRQFNDLYQRVRALETQIQKLQQQQAKIWGS